jgi:hypothetical protein
MIAALLPVAAAGTFVLTGYTNSLPGWTSVVTLADGNKWTEIGNSTNYRPALAGSTVCDGKYIAGWADASEGKFGLFSYDLATKEYTEYATDALTHKITCDPKTPGALLAVVSQPSLHAGVHVDSGASFSLARYTLATQKQEAIGTFPAENYGGYDAMWQFSDDGSEAWAAFPASFGKNGGELVVLDTSTGQTTKRLKFPSRHGAPWHVTPTTGKTTGAAMQGCPGSGDLCPFWATLTLPAGNGTLEVKKTGKWDYLSPHGSWIKCGGQYAFLLSPAAGGAPTQLGLVDPATGAPGDFVDLTTFPAFDTPHFEFTGVACEK